MPVRVVDPLEQVEIDEYDRRLGHWRRARQPGDKPGPVEQPGEQIGEGAAGQLGLGLLARGDVDEGDDCRSGTDTRRLRIGQVDGGDPGALELVPRDPVGTLVLVVEAERLAPALSDGAEPVDDVVPDLVGHVELVQAGVQEVVPG